MARQKGDMETSFEIRSFDARMSLEEYNRLAKAPLYIVVDNMRSAFNAGAIFRLCDAMRVKGLLLCGYTAYPPHVKLEKTSLGTIDYVPWMHFGTTLEAVAWLREQSISVWAAETCSHAVNYEGAQWPGEVAIVLGNEALGVSRDVLEVCDQVVEIPLYGFKNSINVATACAVLGFAFLASLEPHSKKALLPTAKEPMPDRPSPRDET
jgi:23S rRNA (guanosine2251-2'-O)-methyltransferase